MMWMHIESPDYEKAHAGVAISDSPTGLFTYLGSFKPNGEIVVIRLFSKMTTGELIRFMHQNGIIHYILVC